MVGIEDEDWETIRRTEVFSDFGDDLWGDVPDDTFARRSRQLAYERRYGRKIARFSDVRKSEGFSWAERNLIPMPLLREDVIGRVFRYEYNPVTNKYQRKEVVAEKVSVEQIYNMRMEIMEKFDAETKGEKDGI